MKRKDLLTGEPFETNRINQNFANPQNRIKYYNQKAQALRRKTASLNKPLHNNLLILEGLLWGGKEIIKHKQFLLGKGFSFGVHTHFETYKEKRCYALYDYIIVPMQNDQIKIIKK